MLSVIVPTFNEKGNIESLVKRLVKSLNSLKYELVFIDDKSTDGTYEYLEDLTNILPLRVYSKKGPKGKAYSLLQGFAYAQGSVLAMIDADLQYPPEAIPAMIRKLDKYDIVVGKRKPIKKSLRTLLSSIYQKFFGKAILSLNVDVQSGLKVFKREALNNLYLTPSAWGFDYEFLFKAKRMGLTIGQVPISFANREKGQSHIGIIGAGIELALGALNLKLADLFKRVFKFLDWPHPSERLGINYNNTKDFLFLPESYSIKRHIYPETISLALASVVVVASVLWGINYYFQFSVPVIISGFFAIFYLALMIMKLVVIYHAYKKPFLDYSKQELELLSEDDLPVYTILIPLRQEAEVIPQIVRAMTAIDYPAHKLDIIVTLEEYDHETIQAIDDANPPEQFKTLILPNVMPKTKPKALNVAFPHTKGEFLVIYDAEIVPEPDQLKKAVMAFRSRPDISILQTRHDHYNADQSIITRLFNAEFSFHFDMFLPGLQKLGFPIPLSGHSTHFRKSALEEMGAWDPYNVTEDADVGIRAARFGHKVEILNSKSTEEATTSINAWVNQRSRWIKGFIQTAIVHLRHPFRTKQDLGGWKNLIAMFLIVPSSVFINISNLVFWGLLITWFATKAEWITLLYPGPLLYLSFFTFVTGTLMFTYLNLVASYNRERYSLVKYSLLSPLYWMLLAYASVKGAVNLIIKPYHWDKTKHGVHLDQPEEVIVKPYAKTLPDLNNS